MTYMNEILRGSALPVLKTLPERLVNLVVTSPPYFNLRNYEVGNDAIGNETNPLLYVKNVVKYMKAVYRVLKDDGALILVIGDKYYSNNGRHRCNIDKYKRATHKHFAHLPQLKEIDNYRQWKQLLLLPSRIASKMQVTWLLRNEYLWVKKNAIPNGAKDRSSPATERVYFFVKSKKYYFNTDVARKLLPNDVIMCNTRPFKKHQASFPEKLIDPFIQCLSRPGDVILDPFCGSGTVPYLAKKRGRSFIGIDLSEESCKMAEERIK